MTNISDIGPLVSYRTIESYASYEFIEKKSRFIAIAKHVESESQARSVIEEQKKLFPDARHHVYAYVLRENNRVRYSDDGEPKRTAGLPVLDVIEHMNLRDIVIVVARYFGGTLLGTGGLVRAYTSAAQGALTAARIVSLAACRDFFVEIEYPDYDLFSHELENMPVNVLSTDFGAQVNMELRCLSTNFKWLSDNIFDLLNGRVELLADEEKMELVDEKLMQPLQ